jgi:hypothetical protein
MLRKCTQLVRLVLLWMRIALSALLSPLCSLSLFLPSTGLLAAILYYLALFPAYSSSHAHFSSLIASALLARSAGISGISGSLWFVRCALLPLFRIHWHCSWQTRHTCIFFWRSKYFLIFSLQYILIGGTTTSASTSRLGVAHWLGRRQ